MIFEQIKTGGDRNYGYLIACDEQKKCAVVDPSPNPVPVIKRINELNLEVLYVINTHSHFDHTGGNDMFKKKFNSRLILHTSSSLAEIGVDDKQAIDLGTVMLLFFHTPGHTEDSICIKADEELVTGDTLFVGKIGGTYSEHQARVEFDSLKRLMQLHDNTEFNNW